VEERVLFVLWSCLVCFYFLLDFLISGNLLSECDASFTSVEGREQGRRGEE
jgi:hypothetical protein